MNEHITRVSLAEALKDERTDWGRLIAMNDSEIEAAIAADPECFALSDQGPAARYTVSQTQDGHWHWRLLDARGAVLARSDEPFATRADAARAIARVRGAMRSAAA